MAAGTSTISGIYQIHCKTTNKMYIGSAVDIRQRWHHHRRSLRTGEHINRYLQYAWNKYREENFEFIIIETVEQQLLLQAEQKWLDSTRSYERKYGYNIANIAGSPGTALAQVWEGFIDPDGNAVVITNLEDFCRRNDLSSKVMRNLAVGRRNRGHKGWTHRNSVRQREYVKTYKGFIDPNGNEIEPITNLAEFCRQHKLDNTHMVAVLHGRICSHHGWTHQEGRKQEYKTYTGFIAPTGKRIFITNLAEFCRENKLHPVKMRQVKSGQVRSHKGWRWKEDEDHGK